MPAQEGWQHREPSCTSLQRALVQKQSTGPCSRPVLPSASCLRVHHVPPSVWARGGIAPCLSVRALGESGRSEELRQQCHGWELLVSCGHGSGMN